MISNNNDGIFGFEKVESSLVSFGGYAWDTQSGLLQIGVNTGHPSFFPIVGVVVVFIAIVLLYYVKKTNAQKRQMDALDTKIDALTEFILESSDWNSEATKRYYDKQ